VQWTERKSELSQEATAIGIGAGMSPVLETVLLVEDENFVREVTSEILQSAGYRVLRTRNAAEAMRVFRRYRDEVQLLLTDVVMPGQNGCALAQDLRAMCPNLRTIFISGYPENSVTRNGIQPPGVFYLPKPFSAECLLRQVKRILGKTALVKEGLLSAAGVE
jgi:two-component system, cell cycle sensor histidine kinase and response regulator CckA